MAAEAQNCSSCLVHILYSDGGPSANGTLHRQSEDHLRILARMEAAVRQECADQENLKTGSIKGILSR